MERFEKLVWFVALLDKKHGLRMVVLLAPGVVASKLASYTESGSAARNVAASVLVVGILAYIMWGFLKKKLAGDNAIEQDEREQEVTAPAVAPIIPGALHTKLMSELVEMCKGDAAQALQLVAVESEMHPRENYLAAIEYAHRRKSLQITRQSGS